MTEIPTYMNGVLNFDITAVSYLSLFFWNMEIFLYNIYIEWSSVRRTIFHPVAAEFFLQLPHRSTHQSKDLFRSGRTKNSDQYR